MLDELREYKTRGDVLRALLLLDSSERATMVWRKATRVCPNEVLSLISRWTETPEAWSRIRNPAAVAMSQIKKLLDGQHVPYV
jgi:hypothetical protein